MRLQQWMLTILTATLSLFLIQAHAANTSQAIPWEPLSQQDIYPIASALFLNPNSPVVGNANGDVTVVEFLDYQCPHCKEMSPIIDQLIKSNKNVRMVIKETAIMEGSDIPAKAALAAQAQNKFWALHSNLLNSDEPLTQDVVFALALRAKVNTEKLASDMQSSPIERELSDNMYLAHQLNILGTPTYIIAKVIIDPKTRQITAIDGPILIEGGMDLKTLKEAVQYAETSANS